MIPYLLSSLLIAVVIFGAFAATAIAHPVFVLAAILVLALARTFL